MHLLLGFYKRVFIISPKLDKAGFLLSIFLLVGIPAALILSGFTNLKLLFWIILFCYLSGIFMLILNTSIFWLAAALLGLGCAMIFTLALVVISNSSSE